MNNYIQSIDELNKFYSVYDPWHYSENPEDSKRRDILLSEIPSEEYANVLDIGCGHGFLTNYLPGKSVLGIDISQKAIDQANLNKPPRISYQALSVFDLPTLISNFPKKFNLLIITGVLYPQYIGNSSNLIKLYIDSLLAENGVLISVHIQDWFRIRFPYLLVKSFVYSYREFTHQFDVYRK